MYTTHKAERVLYYFACALAITGSLLLVALVLATKNNILVW